MRKIEVFIRGGESNSYSTKPSYRYNLTVNGLNWAEHFSEATQASIANRLLNETAVLGVEFLPNASLTFETQDGTVITHSLEPIFSILFGSLTSGNDDFVTIINIDQNDHKHNYLCAYGKVVHNDEQRVRELLASDGRKLITVENGASYIGCMITFYGYQPPAKKAVKKALHSWFHAYTVNSITILEHLKHDDLPRLVGLVAPGETVTVQFTPSEEAKAELLRITGTA